MIRLAYPSLEEIEKIVSFIHADESAVDVPIDFLKRYYWDLTKERQVVICQENGGITGVIDWWVITKELLGWIKKTSPEEFAATTVKGIYPKHIPKGTVAYISFLLIERQHRNKKIMREMIKFTKEHLNGIERVAWHNHRKKSIETFKLRKGGEL